MFILNSYWNNKGKHQVLATILGRRIPTTGEVSNPRKNKHLERLRKASNVYYDLFNNGLYNNGRAFYAYFGFKSSIYKNGLGSYKYEKIVPLMDKRMDELILLAAEEQNLITNIVIKNDY